MGIYFTGTSTGKLYEVGQKYVTGNGTVKVALADGSFYDPKNKVQSKGSSESSDVSWYASGKDAAGLWDGRRVDVAAQAVGGSGGNPGTPAGAVSVTLPAKSIAGGSSLGGGLSSGVGAAALGAWSGKADPAQDNLAAGFHWQANPKWTNAELWEARYGEVGETLIGLAVLGADIGYNAKKFVQAQGWSQKSVGQALEDAPWAAFNSLMDWRDDYVAKDNAAKQLLEDAEADFNDAWDYRMDLQAVEAQKQGMWSKAPAVW